MEETPLKRQREETHEEEETLKRQKSYKDIISILEEDEEEINEDLSSLITTLQQELSPTSDNYSFGSDFSFIEPAAMLSSSSSSEADPSEIINPSTVEYHSLSPSPPAQMKEEEGEDLERERVIRHLLEASDDELGIPSTEATVDGGQGAVPGEINGGDLLALSDDGLWDLEDEAANYYALLQSELFM
ncbi:hypothetical protein Nepgr_033003 [Nepenthes gracilis]|uniref:Uncharacterized protein n=1 Tax=Nepenthes gracilis TaxID=150966 RepID=A0AAD3TJR2_NEPGR|nr:hypothetical protein Nepgr_033003 [Nepenthes gracilis]